MPEKGESLTVNLVRHIRAPQQVVFDAWTQPEHLRNWWGPGPVTCPEAHVDLRVGGAYRIANLLPSGAVLWIQGVFEVVERHSKLVYSWGTDPSEPAHERVTVEFRSRPDGTTDVVLQHERIPNPEMHQNHLQGWLGCLQGLEDYTTIS